MKKIDEVSNECIKKQHAIVEKSLATGENLDVLLEKEGLTYEDLRYVQNTQLLPVNESYKTLDDFRKPFHGTPIVSFFSGCGGLDLGFEAAGYEHVALIEHNELFCDTLRHNRDWEVLGPPYSSGDVSNRFEINNLLKSYNVNKLFEGVFIGGPPCQPFSIASNQRFSKVGDNFKRTGFNNEKNGNLLFDYIYFIKKYKPKAFLIENVFGLIDLDNGKQVEEIYKELNDSGYTLNPVWKINACNYSVPQQRERVFITGSRTGKPFIEPKKNNHIIPCGIALENINKTVSNNITRKHKANSIFRYMELGFGKRDKRGRVDRLDPRLPSKTVIAGGTSGGGRSHLHPYKPRTLSVRECARLQTFPDDYEFLGSTARQFTQVGNAVPPVLAAQIAIAMYQSYII